MKRVVQAFGIVLAILAAAVLLSLALARVHPFGDPRIMRTHPSSAPLPTHPGIPPDARAILTQKCGDCHSEQTRWPWYGRLAPASWMMERDIVQAREHMDLSRWESLPDDEVSVLKSEIVQQARSRAMPPPQYRFIHTSTALTDADERTLTAWARSDMIGASQAGAPAAPGYATRGKAVFEARCTGCHSLNQNREGPKLAGVVGRTSGTAEGFTYSAALKKAAIRWDPQSIDRWLTDPEALVPDTDMDFHVEKAQERSDVIAYLQASKQLSP
ncbi:MAG: heme-binding domain-containing protein [Acidobacteriaceae bacterium]